MRVARPTPDDQAFADLLLECYERLLGTPLIDLAGGERADARWLYDDAPFCLLAHDDEADPHIIYANRTAQACLGYSWDEMIGLPSRLSAEPQERGTRQAMLEAVARKGFIADYRGIRIAKSGRRFAIEHAVVWEAVDLDGARHGQAAVFRRWRFVEDQTGLTTQDPAAGTIDESPRFP